MKYLYKEDFSDFSITEFPYDHDHSALGEYHTFELDGYKGNFYDGYIVVEEWARCEHTIHISEFKAYFDELSKMYYEDDYSVKFSVEPYSDTDCSQAEALKRLKFERRLELAMESDRFFDLVRWGDAESVLNAYYAGEADVCSIYSSANFTKNKNEYLPIPFAQISASNGIYDQNCGGW